MAKNTKNTGKGSKGQGKGSKGHVPTERIDKLNRTTPFTIRHNLKPAKGIPISIVGTQGAGHGMSYAVSFPGSKETIGITRALIVLGFAGFDRASCRALCDMAGQPDIRDLVIARYAGAGRGQAAGKLTGQIAPLSAEEKKLVASGKKALEFYLKHSGK